MSTSTTTNLQLVKENSDEPILRNHRQHTNDNLDALDTAIKAVQDATATLEKSRLNLVNLIGNIGKDANNADLITKAQARATLDVAQSNGAASTLYAAEQAIATNASAISSLRDSVSYSSVSVSLVNATGMAVFRKIGRLVIATIDGFKLENSLASGSGVDILSSFPNGYAPNAFYCYPVTSATYSVSGRADAYLANEKLRIRNWAGTSIENSMFISTFLVYFTN